MSGRVNILLEMTADQAASLIDAAESGGDLPDEPWLHPPIRQQWEIPTTYLMPGTNKTKDNELVHMVWTGEYDDFLAVRPKYAKVVGAQEFDATITEQEDGRKAYTGVYKPVPDRIAKFLEPDLVYDENGEIVSSTPKPPGSPMHVYAGATPWVWELEARRD